MKTSLSSETTVHNIRYKHYWELKLLFVLYLQMASVWRAIIKIYNEISIKTQGEI
jgi:hypothetical protein